MYLHYFSSLEADTIPDSIWEVSYSDVFLAERVCVNQRRSAAHRGLLIFLGLEKKTEQSIVSAFGKLHKHKFTIIRDNFIFASVCQVDQSWMQNPREIFWIYIKMPCTVYFNLHELFA